MPFALGLKVLKIKQSKFCGPLVDCVLDFMCMVVVNNEENECPLISNHNQNCIGK